MPKLVQYSTEEIISIFGQPNQSGTYLVSVKLPFRLRIAWSPNTTVSSIRCHKLVADSVYNIFNSILKTYGEERIRELGIDLFGGCFNFRAMRGGSSWSRHSWGIAIDLDPDHNQLKWNHTKARFAKPEYKDLISIFESHGWLSYGVIKDYDWMHFEVGKRIE